MSEKTVITCDHCGVAVENTMKFRFTAMFVNGAYDMPNLDACSREHLGLALAKAFGLPIDAKAAELFDEHAKSEARCVFLKTEVKRLEARITELENQLEQGRSAKADSLMHEQDWLVAIVAGALKSEYERQSDIKNSSILATDFAEYAKAAIWALDDARRVNVPAAIDGKTPGQVFAEISSRTPLSLPLETAREIIATSLLRVFGQPSQITQDAVDALRRTWNMLSVIRTDPATIADIMKTMGFIDAELAKLEARPAQSPPDTSTESGLPDAVLAAITLPTKPTKPLRERLEELATYWYIGDKDDKELNGAYRLARQECAKELREVINDPR